MKQDKLTSIMTFKIDKPRGFGFVKYKDERGYQMALSQKQHAINGTPIEVKKAVTREENDVQVTDKIQRNVFLAQINYKLSESITFT